MLSNIESLIKRFAEDVRDNTGYDMTEFEPFLETTRRFLNDNFKDEQQIIAEDDTLLDKRP